MQSFINELLNSENLNLHSYQLDYKLNLIRDNIFNKSYFNEVKRFIFNDHIMYPNLNSNSFLNSSLNSELTSSIDQKSCRATTPHQEKSIVTTNLNTSFNSINNEDIINRDFEINDEINLIESDKVTNRKSYIKKRKKNSFKKNK